MLLDTWAWAEMFESSRIGLQLRNELPTSGIYASALTLAEIIAWCERNGKNPEICLQAIKKMASILDATALDCENAGTNFKTLRKSAPGMGMIDAIIYTQATANGLELVTGDAHFKPFPGVKFIGKEK
jgi:predicted nucleic acid-binding protein